MRNSILAASIRVAVALVSADIVLGQYTTPNIAGTTARESQDREVQAFGSVADAVRTGARSVFTQTESTRILSKLQTTFNSSLASARCRSVGFVSVAEWSPTLEASMRLFLESHYAPLLSELGPDWVDNRVGEWKKAPPMVALLDWQLTVDTRPNSVRSIAVFHRNGDLLYDTLLVEVPVQIIPGETRSARNSRVNLSSLAPQALATVAPTGSDWVETSFTIRNNAGGSAIFHFRIELNAEVSPYITPDKDTGQLSGSVVVKCWKTNPTGIFSPVQSPAVYLGTGGKEGDGNSPFVSPISIGGSVDHFQTGLYQASVLDESGGTQLSISFSVGFGPAGLSIGAPSGDSNGISLKPASTDGRRINIADAVTSSFWNLRY